MSDVPDKDYLYGRYQKDEDWRNELDKKLRHKALDIPMSDDDMKVRNTTTTTQGTGWKEMAVLIAGLVGGGAVLSNMNNKPVVVPATPAVVQPQTPVERQYLIKHYEQQPDGTLKLVPMERIQAPLSPPVAVPRLLP